MDENNLQNQNGVSKNLPEIESYKDKDVHNQSKVEKYDVSHAPTPHVVKVQKSPAKIILTILLIILLAGGCGYLGYLYWQEKGNNSQLQQQLNSAQNLPLNNADTTKPNAQKNVSYSAEVGKFTLTMPASYAIIKNIDGGYEGGPVTELEIGKSTTVNNVIDGNNALSGISIIAEPKAKIGDDVNLSEYIKQSGSLSFDDSTITKQDVTIDGIKTEYYGQGGFGYDEYIFFEKNGIFYQIKFIGVDENKNPALNDVVAGFKFN